MNASWAVLGGINHKAMSRYIFPALFALLVFWGCEKKTPPAAETNTPPAQTLAEPSPSGNPNVLMLKISEDGTAIVDDQGNEIARFTEGIKVKPAASEKSLASGTGSIPGCMCCVDSCIAWDSNGKCVKTYRNCTWDFDCACK